MNLSAEVKCKSEQLSLQSIELQRHLNLRLNSPRFSSFLITFTLAPLLLGVIVAASCAPKGTLAYRLWRIIIPGVRLLKIFQASEK